METSPRHDCGPGGLAVCQDHPKVHVIRDRDNLTWSIWRPAPRPGHVAKIASSGWSDQEAAMRYAQELARILAFTRGYTGKLANISAHQE